ncbi:hypothetical protein OAI07_01995 [Akkermansiaceae bacterium]|nr:hypothetical protein [Akkermansiaceae bacterium]
MNKISYKKTAFNVAKASALALTSALMISCGGGGSGSANVTERPQTLDDLVLTFEELNVQLEFRRSSDSVTTATVATPETGSVDYAAVSFTENIEFSIGLGTPFQVTWPETFESLSYSYQPIDDISGRLTLEATGGSFRFLNTHTTRPFDASVNFATAISNFPNAVGANAGVTWRPTYFLTFINNGSIVTSVDIIAAPESFANTNFIMGAAGFNSRADASYVTSGTLLTNGGANVPLNYTQESLTGTIAETTLDSRTILFTPLVPDPLNIAAVLSPNFEVAFSDDNAGSGLNSETGTASYFQTLTRTTFLDSLEYEYTFQDGIDTATLILTGAVAGTTPGTYILNFDSALNDTQGNIQREGTYEISAPGTTYDGETGTFEIRL